MDRFKTRKNTILSRLIVFILVSVLTLMSAVTVNARDSLTITKEWNDSLTGTDANNREAPSVTVKATMTQQEMVDLFYPVGSYYKTTDSSFNPNNSWTGTWEKVEDGRVLIAANSTYTAGSTGGATSRTPTFTGTKATLSHTGGAVGNHTLTVSEIPSHYHRFARQQWYSADTVANSSTYSIYSWKTSTGGTASKGYVGTSDRYVATGGGGAHNHPFTQPTAHTYTPAGTVSAISTMQPYKAVYIWHRTA